MGARNVWTLAHVRRFTLLALNCASAICLNWWNKNCWRHLLWVYHSCCSYIVLFAIICTGCPRVMFTTLKINNFKTNSNFYVGFSPIGSRWNGVFYDTILVCFYVKWGIFYNCLNFWSNLVIFLNSLSNMIMDTTPFKKDDKQAHRTYEALK